MEKYKFYRNVQKGIEYSESVLVTPERLYKNTAAMKSLGFIQLIITEELMKRILAEYVIAQKYEIVSIAQRDAELESILWIDEFIKSCNIDKVQALRMFSIELEYLDKIVLKKGEDEFFINSTGEYTADEKHKETVHRVIIEFFQDKKASRP